MRTADGLRVSEDAEFVHSLGTNLKSIHERRNWYIACAVHEGVLRERVVVGTILEHEADDGLASCGWLANFKGHESRIVN